MPSHYGDPSEAQHQVYLEARIRGASDALARQIAADVIGRGAYSAFMAGTDGGVQYGITDAPTLPGEAPDLGRPGPPPPPPTQRPPTQRPAYAAAYHAHNSHDGPDHPR